MKKQTFQYKPTIQKNRVKDDGRCGGDGDADGRWGVMLMVMAEVRLMEVVMEIS
jgi:hypothetical protein